MHYVYGLYSPGYEKIYIGRTSNLEHRLLSHNKLGKKGWTIKYRPWELVYKEACKTKEEAIRREKQLKSAQGRTFVWKLIKKKYGE